MLKKMLLFDKIQIILKSDLLSSLGTGTFTTVLEPDAMTKISPIINTIVNAPAFKLLVNGLLAEKEVAVMIGKADKSPPLSRAVFKLPDIPHLKKVQVRRDLQQP